jgi:hypothetical protein
MHHHLPRGPCSRVFLVLCMAALLSFLSLPAEAQTVVMHNSVVSSGGSPGTGGGLRLNATVGQGSGIGRLSGGQFKENVGFWYAVLPEVVPGSVDTLTITLLSDTSAVLTWRKALHTDAYRVFREDFAYFDATGAPWAVVTPPDTTLTILHNGIGSTSSNYAYRVRAWSTGGHGPASNTVGEHDFSSTGTLLKLNPADLSYTAKRGQRRAR